MPAAALANIADHRNQEALEASEAHPGTSVGCVETDQASDWDVVKPADVVDWADQQQAHHLEHQILVSVHCLQRMA